MTAEGGKGEYMEEIRTQHQASGVIQYLAIRLFQLVVAASLLAVMPSVGNCKMQQLPPEANNNAVVRATLPNGLRVIIVKNTLAPVVSMEMNYRVGSNEAPAGFPGTAHALEHMMFRGSVGLSASQLAAVTAGMGGRFDAQTQQSATQYFFTVPARDMDVVLHIEASRMQGVTGGPKGWHQERDAIEQEVAQDLSSPDYMLFSKLLKIMFKGTPYAHDALGTKGSFDKTRWAMLKKFHSAWYRPNNAVLIIVGNVDSGNVLAQVRKRFASIQSRPIPQRPRIKLQPVKPETLHLTTDQSYGYVALAFRMPGWHSPDYAAAQVLADVLSSQRARLYGMVPAGKALFTDFSLESLRDAGLGYAVAGFPKGGDSAVLLQSLRKVMTDMRRSIPAKLVEAAKRNELTGLELRKNSIEGLADLWSQAVGVEGRHSPEDDINAIRAVTHKDVERVARIYLDQAHAMAAIMTPRGSGKPVAARGFGNRESFSPGPNHAATLPAWAKQAVNRLNIPASTIKPTVFTLPNGLKLIVQPETISNMVSIYGHIRNRPVLETARGREGVDEMLDHLFSFGSTRMSRLTFLKNIDDIGANESAGSDFELQVSARHLNRGVQLLADNEIRPALPRRAFKVIQHQVAAEVAGRLHSPAYMVRRSLLAAVYPKGDPTLREATPETVSALTLSDVKAYYHKVYRPDMTTIVVIGDVRPKTARQIIGKYFGSWKARGPKPRTLLPTVPSNRASNIVVPDTSMVQDRVIMAETVGVRRSDPDYYTLELGNHVLGGAFYATRLYRDLRKNAGLVYSVSSFFQVSQTRGLYMIEYACDPPNVSRVRAILAREIENMRATPVSAVELHQAKALMLRKISLDESSVASIARGLLFRATHNLPLDEPMVAARYYINLTAAQVKLAYAKWLRPHDMVQVVQGPPPH